VCVKRRRLKEREECFAVYCVWSVCGFVTAGNIKDEKKGDCSIWTSCITNSSSDKGVLNGTKRTDKN